MADSTLSPGTTPTLSTEPKADLFVQQIVWHRTEATRPMKNGRYRVRNPRGHESVGHYFLATEDEDAGWVTMDFSGQIEYWSELNS